MGDQGVRKYCTSLNGRFRCKFCPYETSGTITRMKYHLSGNHPQKDVRRCKEAPKEVRDEMKQHVLEIKKKNQKKQFLDATLRAGRRYNFKQKKHTTTSSENSYSVRPARENGGKRMEKLSNESSGFDRDNNSREPKRHKPNYGQKENVGSSEPEVRKVPELIMIETSESSDERFEEHTACAFCHSSETSAETGSMLHYSNEQLVSGREATDLNVIHVHRLCIDWLPQVFSDDGKAHNLEAEVARGSNLECSKCGKNGAALRCYEKSCPGTYHVPCALRISKCRWDDENYLMLCPSHSFVRFPKEKLTSAENGSKGLVMPSKVSCQLSDVAALPDKERKRLLCGSDLSIKEKSLLVNFGKMDGSSVSKFWDPNVTHVIAATDETGACTRTLKVLMAILNGIWIVKLDWIKACIEAKSYVDEEPFEINLDNYGCCDGPKNGRLRAFNNDPKLFGGLKFYFVGDFSPLYNGKDLEDLVVAGGGSLIKSKDELSGQKSDVPVAGQNLTLVIYNLDLPKECEPGEEALIMWRRLSEAKDLVVQSRSRVIGHIWLLESIAAYKLQPLTNYHD